MESELAWIAEVTGAEGVQRGSRIQSLWSGYGELFRVHLDGTDTPSAVVKWVRPPARTGRAVTDISHRRKCRSYDVETAFYRSLAARCDATCRVPALLGSRISKERWLLLLEDLDAAGFSGRRHRLDSNEIDLCLSWLAAFHARFLGVAPEGLWKTGTYWHLATRPDELAAIADDALRKAAPRLDQKLCAGSFHTIVHGDAKLANFCFADDGQAVAAVDFQYVGGGCGMKDVAYFLSSCTHSGLELDASRHLDAYFAQLRQALDQDGVSSIDVDALELEWRALYPIACADFYRFLAGWAKEHWQADERARRFVRRVIEQLD